MRKRTISIAKTNSNAPATGASDAACGWATLATGVAISGFLLWRNHQPMDFNEYNLLNTALILFVPLVVILLLLRREASDFGMTPGDLKGGVIAALLLFVAFIPILLLFAPMDGPQEYYLNWLGEGSGSGSIRGLFFDGRHWSKGGTIEWARLAYHELTMAFYMFGWEWFYRGFLLFGLSRLLPIWGAVGVQTLLFAALHWGKPLPETLSSLPGGVLMALLALRYRSFLPCFLLHTLISAGFDAAVLYNHFYK
jgi:hypothetical protein